jgi:mono/diheme cytochrome c family protein
MKRVLKVLAILAAIAATAGGLLIYSGWYNVSATDEHLVPTYWLLDTAMRRSVREQGKRVAVPPLDDPAMVQRGLAIYRQDCVRCHGAPGVAPERFALGMTPSPANLAYTAREWPAGDLFWVVKYGLKMTGMPAWEFRLGDDEVWATVAFLKRMPHISPQEYAALQAPSPVPRPADAIVKPDAERGKRAIHQYACLTCHAIPGLVGAHAPVGPPLDGIASRAVIAGTLPNTPENLARWLRAPRQVNPGSAMPDLGVTERDARDITAYLSTLK